MTSVTSAGSGTLSSSSSYRLLNAQISPLATALEINSRSNCLLPTGLARSHSISICSFSAAVKDISNTWDSIAFRTSRVRCKRYRSGRRLARAKRQDGRSSAARLAHARRPIFARCRAQSIQANSVEYSAICLTTRCLRRGPRWPDQLAGAAGARRRRSPLSPAAGQQKTQQFLAIGAKLCSSFVLTILAKENAARARLSRNRSANRALRSSADLRAARPLEIRAGATHRRCSQPRRVARQDRGAGGVKREADARHHLRPPGLGSRGSPHAASGRAVRSDPGRPSQRGAARRVRDDGRKPRGGRPGGDNHPRARPLSWGFCRRRAPPLRAVVFRGVRRRGHGLWRDGALQRRACGARRWRDWMDGRATTSSRGAREAGISKDARGGAVVPAGASLETRRLRRRSSGRGGRGERRPR